MQHNLKYPLMNNLGYSHFREVVVSLKLMGFVRSICNRIKSRVTLWRIHKINPVKIEIGGGEHPTEGYYHLDARSDLPCWAIDIIHNIARPLPLPDESISEILTNHCIEHLGWHEVPAFLSECHRVLIRGGKLKIRTPDLEEIARRYLRGELHPGTQEEASKLESAFGRVNQGALAILKLFALQTYKENYHGAVFDWETLRDCLLRQGFADVQGPHAMSSIGMEELQVIATKSL